MRPSSVVKQPIKAPLDISSITSPTYTYTLTRHLCGSLRAPRCLQSSPLKKPFSGRWKRGRCACAPWGSSADGRELIDSWGIRQRRVGYVQESQILSQIQTDFLSRWYLKIVFCPLTLKHRPQCWTDVWPWLLTRLEIPTVMEVCHPVCMIWVRYVTKYNHRNVSVKLLMLLKNKNTSDIHGP